MWSKFLWLQNGELSDHDFPLRGTRMPPAPEHLPRSLHLLITARDWSGEPLQYTSLEIYPLWIDEDTSRVWMDPGARVSDVTSQEKALLRAWLIGRSWQAWSNAVPEIHNLLAIECVNLRGDQARTILQSWNLRPGGRWDDVLAGWYDGRDADFALYGAACPHDECPADVLVGFGGSGDESDAVLAICQQAHESHIGPDACLRTEEAVDNDCWEHRHAGPHPCPACPFGR